MAAPLLPPLQFSSATTGRTYTLSAQPLAAGGYASLYRATDDQGRAVAVKYYQAASERDIQREAAVLQRVTRAQVPDVLHGLDGPVYSEAGIFLVVEWIEGHTLYSFLVEGYRRRQPGPDQWTRDEALALSRKCVALLQQLVRVVTQVHAVCVVHRDLKPANIMLTDTENDRYHATVVDWGEGCFLPHCGDAADELDPQWQCDFGAFGTSGYNNLQLPAEYFDEEWDPALWTWSDWYSVGAIGLHLTANLAPDDHRPIDLFDVDTGSPEMDSWLKTLLFPRKDDPPHGPTLAAALDRLPVNSPFLFWGEF